MTDREYWELDGKAYGWIMPQAAWWKRLPVIRHIRCAYLAGQVRRHNAFWTGAGKIPTGYDNWVLYGIRIGKERPL
jgi:hypothetical protein